MRKWRVPQEVLMGWPGLGVPIPHLPALTYSPGPSQLQGALGIRIPGMAATSQSLSPEFSSVSDT